MLKMIAHTKAYKKYRDVKKCKFRNLLTPRFAWIDKKYFFFHFSNDVKPLNAEIIVLIELMPDFYCYQI